MAQTYLIALGSNVRHPIFGAPELVIRAAAAALDGAGIKVKRVSPVTRSAPLGPSRRRFANSAAVVKTRLDPERLLERLQDIELAFGRRRTGQPWGPRVLDLDMVLWRGGTWSGPGLTIPHPAFRTRSFVLVPALAIAADWRDPLTGLTLRQIHARLTRPRALPRARSWSGP